MIGTFCSGWLMEAKRPNGSTALLYVEPKTQTIVDVDSANHDVSWQCVCGNGLTPRLRRRAIRSSVLL